MIAVNTISICDLVNSYAVPSNTIKSGIQRNKQGTPSWQHTQDPSDHRKVLIYPDTIPAATRKKYGILTTAEQEEQEVRKSEQLRAIYDDKIKKHIYKRLTNALDAGFKKYLHEYNDYGFTSDLRREKARLHALYHELLLVVGKNKTRWGMKAPALEVLQYLNLKKPISDTYSFSRLLTKARKDIKKKPYCTAIWPIKTVRYSLIFIRGLFSCMRWRKRLYRLVRSPIWSISTARMRALKS